MRIDLKVAANAVSRRLWSLESQELCFEAQRRADLLHFGHPPPEPALSILVNSLEKEANLHPLGRFLIRVHLRDLLETRLRLVEYWRIQKESLPAVRIERPVFITGMPRSGSTFLQELLAEDTENRAPRVWEVMFPCPPKEASRRGEKRRIRKAETCLWWFRRLAPRADAVHPIRAQSPHECVAIHSYTFLSEEFISTCHIPSYEAFLHSTDLTPAYAWEKCFLQHLQLHCPSRRWILKCPDHLFGLEQLFSVFPDAFVIQTHRNPLEVLHSLTDLLQVLRGLYGESGDRSEIRTREARLLAEATERSIKFRDLHPDLASRFIDVKYDDLVADPITIIRQIYQRLDFPLTSVAVERMQHLASHRSRYRGQRTVAGSDGYLETQEEAKRFQRYCSRFDLPLRMPELR
jgi:hypothetical protein